MSISKVLTSLGFGRKRAIQINKVVIIVLCWLFIGLLVTLYDYFLLSSEMSKGYAVNYNFQKDLAFNLSAGFMGSFLGGIWLVFYVNERLREKPYGFNLIMVALSFFVIVSFIALTLGVAFVRYETGFWPFSNDTATADLYQNLANPFHLKNIVVWGSIVLLTQLGLQINDKFGQGMLWAFIWGRYHRSKREQRVFMFVDLIGSTSIAEQLGNDNYYKLLKDFFADITDSIIYNGGNIYQYVGDEVVISWECGEKTIRHEFLNCYFDMRRQIEAKRQKYLDKYSLVPDFKAAVHYGDVTVGEVGIIKRELTFSGDVLNTAARMLGYCKKYEKNILISEKLFDYLAPINGQFEYVKMGGRIAPWKIGDYEYFYCGRKIENNIAMSAKQNRDYTHTEVLEIYEKLISEFPTIERKGKTTPYTSVNGHMFSFLDKNGKLSLRLPEVTRNELIKKHDTELSVRHGRIMKEYVLVPEKLLNNSKDLERYFKESHEYVSSLKPNTTKKVINGHYRLIRN